MPFIKPNNFTLDENFTPPDFGGQIATMHGEISYTDTSAKPLFILPQNSVIVDLYLDVKTAFNDSTGNAITVSGADGSLLASVDVSSIGVTRYGDLGIAKSAYTKPTYINGVFTGATGNASAGNAVFVCAYYVTTDELAIANQQSNLNYYPSLISNLGFNVWDWSTLNAGTMFQDSAKTTPAVANADPVGCWVDRVKLTDATQVTTANKPGLATASLNGLPTLSFDGGDLLATANISISTFAVWVVYRSTASNDVVFEHGTGNISADPDNGMTFFSADSSNPFRVQRGNVDAYKNSNVVLADGTYKIVRMSHNGTYATFNAYINNLLVSTTTATNNDLGTATATENLYIGGRGALLFPLNGNIAHLCIVSPYPTPAIIASMESYINGIWGVY